MNIGINTFGCDHSRSGVGSYILSLVKNLPKSPYSIDLFGPELDKYTYTSGIDTATYTGIAIADNERAEKLWHSFSCNKFIQKQKYDLVVYPSGIKMLPTNFTVPSILVIQDIIGIKSNNFLSFFGNINSKRMLNQSAGIISPSNYIKNDLIRLGITPSKIQVIHNGIDTDLFYPRKIDDNESVLMRPFAIRRPYIIYASRIEYPAKRHVELVKAFSLFKQKTQAPHRLVIAGAEGVNSELVHQEVIRSPVSSDILLTGYFPHENLPALYSAADLCVFPSSVEGVGLSVIEAMACGIPTACARAGALPEIAGEHTCYFNQEDPEEIAAIIEKLVKKPDGENDELRNTLIAGSIEWVKQYSWKTTAEQTLAYIEKVYK
ncbi:glycosyltransferase family 4 protein [Treponema phagedenis]|uniref:glycosyltransferase family 4 protein n=1 Tax=Treponema phagedenis TaxID=162 RepID=UPI001652EE44|nr:glycosyltransferase family 1 protein [Treponema phagedenis]